MFRHIRASIYSTVGSQYLQLAMLLMKWPLFVCINSPLYEPTPPTLFPLLSPSNLPPNAIFWCCSRRNRHFPFIDGRQIGSIGNNRSWSNQLEVESILSVVVRAICLGWLVSLIWRPVYYAMSLQATFCWCKCVTCFGQFTFASSDVTS